MPKSTREMIFDFMRQKRLAIVGVSRNPKDFSRALYREFVKQGYDVVPVNDKAEEIEGSKCFNSLQNIDPPVEEVLLMTPPEASASVLRNAADAGIRRAWQYRAVGKGAVHPEAVAFCREKGIDLIEGYCPLMFLPKAQFVHRVHGFFMKLVGAYPA
jgi:predicted CoA-binding protein